MSLYELNRQYQIALEQWRAQWNAMGDFPDSEEEEVYTILANETKKLWGELYKALNR